MDMTHKPVLLLHICAGFDVEIAAARQRCNEQIRLEFFTGDRIKILNSFPGPIDLHGVSGLVCNTHGRFRYTSPAAVFVTKLRTHVGLLAVCVGTLAVFIPKKSDGHAFLGQFAVNVLVVDDGVRRRGTFTFAIEQLIKHLVGYVVIKRPRDVSSLARSRTALTV